MLSLSGVEHRPTRGFDGIDLSSSLAAADDAKDAGTAEDRTAAGDDRILHFQWSDGWAVLHGDWKLIGSNTSDDRRLLNVTDENPEGADYLSARFVNDGYRERAALLEREHTDWLAHVRPGYEEVSDASNDRE
jgi:hypothetical protein